MPDETVSDQLSAQGDTRSTQPPATHFPAPLLPLSISSRPVEQQPPKTCTRCRKRLWGQRLDTAVKVFGILAFLLSCAALCPSICGQEDTHRATQLAEWAALKDFIEYCESHGWQSDGCDGVRNVTLPRPPEGHGHLRRFFEGGKRISVP
ncbi:hypothetical protein KVR01_009175 [Diaporthe batatas]|uniref:uncharacterized protein n=1 Tax=Diaporthe batatas TaxID=748121 RepID=UPI001D051578|nr:uncharacterized protein KVR01_009175 [Diaporthe batatas]KAG8160911.1 hypothetical protein KVR01_009175 [Diaporthe batatas]